MKETDDVASRRKACKEMKELLQRALEILNEVMELSRPDTVYLERKKELLIKSLKFSREV